MPNVKNTMIDKMLSVVAPHLCSGCGKTGTLLCDHCKYDIINKPYIGCVLCERPNLRGICKKHETAYQQVWVVGTRKDALQRLIDGFKFQNMKAAAWELAGLLDSRLPELPKSTVVIPLPTASSHVRQRGYDHTLLVARYFAQQRKLTLDTRLLTRNHSATQHVANRTERIAQAMTAFKTVGVANPEVHYVIIDDVVTTGSSIAEASTVLARAGATRISVAVIARQPSTDQS